MSRKGGEMMAIKPGTILAILLPFFLASVLDTTTGSRYVSRCCIRIEFTRLHRRYPLTFPRSNTEIVDLRRLRLALLFNLDDRRTVGPASSSLIFLVGIYHYTHDRRLQSLSLSFESNFQNARKTFLLYPGSGRSFFLSIRLVDDDR